MDKLKLLEITFTKLSDDKSYFAYYLKRLMLTENKTQDEILELLNCPVENFYQLALCKAPEHELADFNIRIKKIADYTQTSEVILSNIIAHFTVTKPEPLTPSIFAESWSIFKRLIPIPAWIYQPLFTSTLVLLIMIPAFSGGKGNAHLQLYVGDYIHYTDSVKYLLLPDKTAVYKNNL